MSSEVKTDTPSESSASLGVHGRTPNRCDESTSIDEAVKDWIGAAATLASKYSDLVFYEVRSASSAVAAFLAVNVVLALLLVFVWLSGFTAAGLTLLNSSTLAVHCAAMVFCGASVGAGICLVVRQLLHKKIRANYSLSNSIKDTPSVELQRQ